MLNKRLISLCAKSKKYIWLSILVKWLSLLCNIGIVFIVGLLINAIISHLIMPLHLIIIGGISCIGVRFLCNYLTVQFAHLASHEAKKTLRTKVFDQLLALGVSYTQHTKSASVIQMAGEGIESLENYFGKYLPQIFYALLAPITLFGVLSFISLKTSAILLICVPLIPLSIVAFMKIAKKLMKKYWGNYTDLAGTFLENLQGLTTLKLFSADKKRHQKINTESERFRKTTMKVLSMQLNSITIMDIIAYGGAAAGSIIALLEYRAGLIDIDGFIIIVLLSAEFFIPLRMLGSFFHIATTSMASAEKIFELLDIEVESCANLKLSTPINDISFKNLSFGYTNDEMVLKNVSFNIHKNQFVGFAGESGSGKSTIASLIMKMYCAPDGQIQIDGTDINQISNDDILKNFNLLSTDSHIFNTTIRSNLLMASPAATDDQMMDALSTARLSDFVQSLPDGLDTKAGEDGGLLSGGQKQRLAFARAILANRQVMIFDEATSNIDCESEAFIWDAINQLKGSKTIIAISHRLANLRNADCIYMLKDGHIVECGTHEMLVENQDEYYKMHQLQSDLESYRGKAS